MQAIFGVDRVRQELQKICAARKEEYKVGDIASVHGLSVWEVATSASQTQIDKPALANMFDEDRLAATYWASLLPPHELEAAAHLIWQEYYHHAQEDASELLMRLLDEETGCPS